jgi:hypothetical protein
MNDPDIAPLFGHKGPAPAVSAVPDAALTLIKLEDGAPVHLILSETISSADAQVVQTIEFEVVDDIRYRVQGECSTERSFVRWASSPGEAAGNR